MPMRETCVRLGRWCVPRVQFTGKAETVMSITTRPILFSGEMVRAILSGRKTQTRRIMKPQPDSEPTAVESVALTKTNSKGIASPGKEVFGAYGDDWFCKCPYGAPGYRLWVRETWGLHDTEPQDGPKNARVYYRSTDGERHDLRYQLWRPSIHMPRWASRITLEITDIGVERLKDISNEDCTAEGITAIGKGVRMSDGTYAQAGRYETKASTVRQLYSELWESINGPGSWEKNPWVWVVTFEVIEGEK